MTIAEPQTTTKQQIGNEHPWHTCTAHPYEGDGPCGPGCVYLCGQSFTGRPARTDVAPHDLCVVCEDLFVGHPW